MGNWTESVRYVETFFDPFYARARRFAGLGATSLDVLVETGGVASIEGSGWLTIDRPAMGDVFHFATPEKLDRPRLDEWVAEFNRRAAENRGPES